MRLRVSNTFKVKTTFTKHWSGNLYSSVVESTIGAMGAAWVGVGKTKQESYNQLYAQMEQSGFKIESIYMESEKNEQV